MVNWSVIIITCSTPSVASHVQEEIKFLQKKNHLSPSLTFLTVEDPADNIGSGAATVNALLYAAEYLSAENNYSVVNVDVLAEAHILIFHQGKECVFSGSCKSFITLPRNWHEVKGKLPNGQYGAGSYTNLEILFETVQKLAKDSPPGVWICSTDMTLQASSDLPEYWENPGDVVLFCVLVPMKHAVEHGCVVINEEGHVANIIYGESRDVIEQYKDKDERVPIVSGIVYMTPAVAESLLSFLSQSLLESCTYYGLDSGAELVQASLYFDILIAMAANVRRDEFLFGKCAKNYNTKHGYPEEHSIKMAPARTAIWKELSKFKMTAGIITKGFHCYWSNEQCAKNHIENLLLLSPAPNYFCHSVQAEHEVSSPKLLVNSMLSEICVPKISEEVVITNSRIFQEDIQIGEDCYISGLDIFYCDPMFLHIPSHTVVLSFLINDECLEVSNDKCQVFVLFGTSDKLTLPKSHPESTFGNRPWSEFFNNLSITDGNIWDHNLPLSKRTLMSAKLYTCGIASLDEVLFLLKHSPGEWQSTKVERWKNSHRLSLEEIMKLASYGKMMDLRRCIYSEISGFKLKNYICYNRTGFDYLPYFVTSCVDGCSDILIRTLDQILQCQFMNVIVVNRALSAMADLLATMTGKVGGLRSGPGNNWAWSTAHTRLLEGNIHAGLQYLIKERTEWLNSPIRTMRAARHFERAVQILIQNSVKTAKEFIALELVPLPSLGTWVCAECPARVDFQGGWTDTPPICYELGGSVVNIAVLIDGEKPIGAKACRKDEPNIQLIFGPKNSPTSLILENKEDVLDYDQPYAQGSLLKAALVCANIVDPTSDMSLSEQVLEKCKAGIIVQAWSNLPQGCGMGASSILAGAVIAVLWSISGKKFDKLSVVHAVLYIEQLLTTGGGWQDQVGGIIGGINRGVSKDSLPLHVEYTPIPVMESFITKLEMHLVLIYTGKVRLAKNILQTVIRGWYAKNGVIVKCLNSLLKGSHAMEKALSEGNLPKIGSLMNSYWQYKKTLTPGSEPSSIKRIMSALEKVCYGQCLAGAGGGGFMYILTKEPNAKAVVEDLLTNENMGHSLTFHSVSVDFTGMTIHL